MARCPRLNCHRLLVHFSLNKQQCFIVNSFLHHVMNKMVKTFWMESCWKMLLHLINGMWIYWKSLSSVKWWVHQFTSHNLLFVTPMLKRQSCLVHRTKRLVPTAFRLKCGNLSGTLWASRLHRFLTKRRRAQCQRAGILGRSFCWQSRKSWKRRYLRCCNSNTVCFHNNINNKNSKGKRLKRRRGGL